MHYLGLCCTEPIPFNVSIILVQVHSCLSSNMRGSEKAGIICTSWGTNRNGTYSECILLDWLFYVSCWSALVMKTCGGFHTPCHIPCPSSISHDISPLTLTLKDTLPYMSLYTFQSQPDTLVVKRD